MRTDTPPAPPDGARRGSRGVLRRHRAARSRAALVGILALPALAALSWPTSAEAGAGHAAAALAASTEASGATMQLLDQTAWVGSSGLTISLALKTALPASSLAVQVVLYDSLHTRSGFEASLAGPASLGSLVIASPTMPLSELHTSTSGGKLETTLHLSVTTGYPSGTTPATTVALGCPVGQCDGVYPMEVQLLDERPVRRLLTGFTTYLDYAAAEEGTIPLDVGLVLPVGTQPALDPTGAPALSEQRLDELESLLGDLESYPDAPVDLELYSQLALALSSDHTRLGHAVLTRLRVVARQEASRGAVHELLAAPFAPTDVDALTGAGLSADVAAQLGRGEQVARSVLGAQPVTDQFVAGGDLDDASLATLAAAGVHRLVLPAADVDATPIDDTFAGRLTLERAPGGTAGGTARGNDTFAAFAADPGLAPFFDTSTADPVLAAQQLLAELALIFFEAPDAPVQRTVVIAPPNWNAGPAFAQTLLAALSPSPHGPQSLVRSEPLSTLFALPAAAGFSPGSGRLAGRRLAAPASLAREISSARHAVRVLESIIPADAARRQQLSDSILLSETAGLSPAARQAYLAAAPQAVRDEGNALDFSGNADITLTSASGSIPIEIESFASTEVWVVVRLASGSGLTSLSPPETVGVRGDKQVTLRVGVRTSGTFNLDVELTSPLGGVVLKSKQYEVLSTVVSPVAIALSIGALLVLAVWWFRSSRRRRRQRAGRGGGTVPPAVPAI